MILSDYDRGLIVQRRTHQIKGSRLKGLTGVTQSNPKGLIRKGSNRYALVLWEGRKTPEPVAVRVLERVVPR